MSPHPASRQLLRARAMRWNPRGPRRQGQLEDRAFLPPPEEDLCTLCGLPTKGCTVQNLQFRQPGALNLPGAGS